MIRLVKGAVLDHGENCQTEKRSDKEEVGEGCGEVEAAHFWGVLCHLACHCFFFTEQ